MGLTTDSALWEWGFWSFCGGKSKENKGESGWEGGGKKGDEHPWPKQETEVLRLISQSWVLKQH